MMEVDDYKETWKFVDAKKNIVLWLVSMVFFSKFFILSRVTNFCLKAHILHKKNTFSKYFPKPFTKKSIMWMLFEQSS
jgi:hypothetical protein